MSNLKVNYDNISSDFSKSRVGMKWPEIDYFIQNVLLKTKKPNILDIGCGSARLLEQINSIGNYEIKYSGVDNSNGMLEEAKKNHPNCEFILSDMINISTSNSYNIISFIASFHHLNTLKDREDCLSNIYKIVENDGYIFMTNWALNSKINDEKYKNSIIPDSKNEFGSTDYMIKFGEYDRYYHCFDLKELEYLAQKTGFKIVENKLFENNKNFITILQK